MEHKIITDNEITTRRYWVNEICRLSGDFGDDSDRVEQEVSKEIKKQGVGALLGHLRLCGSIPEKYDHDSSEEKLYSKYTDILIHEAFKAMGFTSLVLRERADAADVECVCKQYSFIADAKAFRLSRTAKNQKDFKIQAMDNWKHGKPFAMVVCPAYQLPSRTSQIYQQAAARSVCLCTYTHLAAIVRNCQQGKPSYGMNVVHEMFRAVDAMNPSKNAAEYWQPLNQALLNSDKDIRSIWRDEKIASLESLQLARAEAIQCMSEERERIMKLTHQEAIREVIQLRKIENKTRIIQTAGDNGILEME